MMDNPANNEPSASGEQGSPPPRPRRILRLLLLALLLILALFAVFHVHRVPEQDIDKQVRELLNEVRRSSSQYISYSSPLPRFFAELSELILHASIGDHYTDSWKIKEKLVKPVFYTFKSKDSENLRKLTRFSGENQKCSGK